jgi:hypothetical protein
VGGVWVKNGFFDHFILGVAQQDWLEPWLKLGIGYEQAHALLDLEKLDFSSLSINPRFNIRKARQEDRGIVQSGLELLALSLRWLVEDLL